MKYSINTNGRAVAIMDINSSYIIKISTLHLCTGYSPAVLFIHYVSVLTQLLMT